MSAATLALDFGGEATPVSPLAAPHLLLEQLRWHLQAHFPHRAQGAGLFALTECELMDARNDLRRFAPVYATGFTPEKKR